MEQILQHFLKEKDFSYCMTKWRITPKKQQ
jgi:hypothetical protein